MTDTKKGIILKRIYNICVFSSFLVFTILSFAIINPIKNSNAAPQVIDNTVGAYSMSMTASSEADAHAIAGYEQDTHTELDSIVVSNTCPDGSSVMLSSDSETGALVGDNGIEISATEPGGELSDNSWGFSIDGGSVWNAVPTADENPIVVYSKKADQTDPIMIPVLYGFKIDRNAVRDGIYTANVLYTMAPDAGCFIYKISWESSGGEIPEGFPEYLDQDDRIDLSALPRPTRPHYDFAGWQINGITYTGNETAVDINPDNSASIVVKTLWTPTNYTISYNLNGGVVETENPTSYNIESEAITLNNPTREHYTFRGWSGTGLTGDTNKNVVIPTGSFDDRSYTANWDPIPYDISYSLSGGTTTNPITYNIETSTINLSYPEKTAYTFTGWSGTGLSGNDNLNVSIPTGSYGNRSYTAYWTPTNYSISYTLNGGAVATANPSSYNIESNAFTLNNPTRTYYTFKGWSGTGLTGSANTSVTVAKGSYGNRSYAANWTPVNYSITYNYNGGSATNPATYNIETNTFTLNNPTRSSYTFTGWSGTGLSGSANTSVSITKGSVGNRSYTANWKLATYAASVSTYGASRSCERACDCPHGSLNGPGHCAYDESVGISVSWRESCGPYTCNSGDSLSGSTCYHYSCPNGGRLSGTTCYL